MSTCFAVKTKLHVYDGLLGQPVAHESNISVASLEARIECDDCAFNSRATTLRGNPLDFRFGIDLEACAVQKCICNFRGFSRFHTSGGSVINRERKFPSMLCRLYKNGVARLGSFHTFFYIFDGWQ